MFNVIFLISLIFVCAGCQSFAGEDVSVTLASEMDGFATESVQIQQTAQAEQTIAVETLQASGTMVANASNSNRVLAATVRANAQPTTVMREVIVNPDDMGSSLDPDMLDETGTDNSVDLGSGEMQITNTGIARSVRTSDGCSNGAVTEFTDSDERIYFTAQVTNLSSGTNFSIDWVFEERLVYRTAWTADYSASSECIWFYMTQDDAPFLPGLYTATFFVNGATQTSQQFTISAG